MFLKKNKKRRKNITGKKCIRDIEGRWVFKDIRANREDHESRK